MTWSRRLALEWAALKLSTKESPTLRHTVTDTQIIAFFTCGGCSGRRVYRLVNALKKHGLDAVHLSSCMLMEDTYPKCPNLDSIKKTIQDAGIEIVEGTHH